MRTRSAKRFRAAMVFAWVLMFMLAGMITANAAVKVPAQVTGIKATAKNKAVKLTWKKVKNVDGYHVYMRNKKGEFERIQIVAKGTTTSATVEGLKNGTAYKFRVSAYKMGENNRKTFGLRSKIVTAKPHKPYIDSPMIRLVREGNRTITVKWNKVEGAKNYDVTYVRKDTNKKVKAAKGMKGKKIVLNKVKNDVAYKIAIRANGVRNGKTIHSEWTTVEATPYDPERQNALLSQINHTNAYSGGIEPSIVYADNVAEAFANYGNGGNAFGSNTDYFLWLNTHGLHLYIFKRSAAGRWKVLYKFPVAIGRPSNQTPSGLWILDTKQYIDDHGSFYVLYCTFFTGYNTNSIHSQCYPVQQDPLIEGYYGSAGCVRCDLKYAKFVYENCEGSPFLVR